MSINICFLTAQIISKPKHYILLNKTILTYLFLRFPNPKKGKTFYYGHGFALTQSTKNIYLWYNKADYIIIHANILNKSFLQNHNSKKKILLSILLKVFLLVYIKMNLP